MQLHGPRALLSSEPMSEPTNDAHGHRARLRARLLADSDGLLDYELVEYLLTLAMRRGDTKSIAKRLLARFGGLAEVLTADAEALQKVKGMGEVSAAAVKIAHAAALRLLKARVADKPVLSNWQALLDYLHADMAHHPIERVRVLHLNTRNVLIRDELISEGSIEEAAVHVREVVRRAMDLGSAALILVHNHPSGDPSPSRADIDLTRSIAEAGKRLNIAVHDHVIIGVNGHSSLRSLGLI